MTTGDVGEEGRVPDSERHGPEALLREAERALREAESLLEHANLRWDGWKVADRIAAHFGRSTDA